MNLSTTTELACYNQEFHESNHMLDLLFVGLGAVAGSARYLHEMFKGNRPFRFMELLAKAFISSFVGLSAGHLSLSWGLDENMIFVFTSLAAWMGADGAELMIQWIKSKFFPPSMK